MKIYEILRKGLLQKLVRSEYSSENAVDCAGCKITHGCCKRRELILCMVENILNWLHKHRTKLQEIEFPNEEDTEFVQEFVFHPSGWQGVGKGGFISYLETKVDK